MNNRKFRSQVWKTSANDLDQEVKRFSTNFNPLSNYQREKQMEKQFNQVKLKNYKPQKTNMNYFYAIFSILFVLAGLILWKNCDILFK